MDWSGSTAVVTGAGQGIGLAIACELASRGAFVVGADIDGEAAERAALHIRGQGGRASPRRCDVTDSAAVDALMAGVVAEHARVDILVNNAGITRTGMLWNLSDEDWHAVLRTNLSSQFFTTRAAVQASMKEHGGAIVNVASIAGLRGAVGQVNYAAAKAGVVGLTKASALELGRYGVRVNAVAPGTIRTDMTRALLGNEKLRRRYEEEIVVGRFGEPQDVAGAVAYLASPEAGFVTGKVLTVDGGAYN